MEKVLKKFVKCELIAILLELCDNKATYNRIKTILKKSLEEA